MPGNKAGNGNSSSHDERGNRIVYGDDQYTDPIDTRRHMAERGAINRHGGRYYRRGERHKHRHSTANLYQPGGLRDECNHNRDQRTGPDNGHNAGVHRSHHHTEQQRHRRDMECGNGERERRE